MTLLNKICVDCEKEPSNLPRAMVCANCEKKWDEMGPLTKILHSIYMFLKGLIMESEARKKENA